MSKAKGKGGTGRGTDSKGWTRWNKSAKAKTVGKRTGVKIGPGSVPDQGDKKSEVTKRNIKNQGVAVVRNNKVVIEEK